MIEQKLQQAADRLPEHTDNFLSVEETVRSRQSQPRRKPTPHLALMFCVCLLLVGCVTVPTVPEYHLYSGAISAGAAQRAAKDAGWTIPETLGKSPKLEERKYNLTTKETSYLVAQLFYHYTYHAVEYGHKMETDITLEDGSPSVAVWEDADVDLTFGSMDNEVWRRQFSFDENDVWIDSSKHLDYIDSYSLQYEGFTLYVGTCKFDNDFYGLLSYYCQFVSWVDHDHNTVFQISARDDTPDFAIACAKELIDQLQ